MKNIYKPMLYSTPMVQGLLEVRKNQTRRTKGLEKVNENPDQWIYDGYLVKGDIKNGIDTNLYHVFKNKITNERIDIPEVYKKGDILWVRENLYQNGEEGIEYSAFGEAIDEGIIPFDYGPYGGEYSFRTIPSIHMPKWACRIFLNVISVKMERLFDITEEDAKYEGIFYDELFKGFDCYMCSTSGHIGNGQSCNDGFFIDPRASFYSLWISINGADSFKSNPWVWVIKFERIEKPLDFMV
jgi:hypothetical protein